MRKYYRVNLTVNQLKRIESWYQRMKEIKSLDDIRLYEKLIGIRYHLENDYEDKNGPNQG